ncbi:MAG: DUF547 domain-containing protein [Gammaproteobacteria bacterium]|nr:DUF547 domain-containing protein [Gammaproteobacteria bacterium]
MELVLRRSALPMLLLLALAQPAGAAPSAKLWDKWTARDDGSVREVDHSVWDAFLIDYVRTDANGINRIPYASVSDADQRALADYLAALKGVAVSELNRPEQLAYWINLYNALTVKVVLDHYPVSSIRDIKSGFFSIGPWRKKRVQVQAEQLSLDDIEHRILRPIWRDPRIHYAVNCAALGCPNLQAKAFTASAAERMLEKAAREFINHPRAVTFENGELVVSSIFEWFKEDFGDGDQDVIKHLSRYASPELAAKLAGVTRIDDDRYDWQLNDAEP